MPNPIETWKAAKHGFDVWPDVERYAAAGTPMKDIDPADLERMKWYGFFYRKRDQPGRYMTRIRITANELSADQAREIAHLAYEYGHGIIDVTTRANLQIQGLEIAHLPQTAQRLARVGLTSKQTGHDNIRNVFGHPFSGLLPDELIDTRELCHQITAIFLDQRAYADLPRKFNICLNGMPNHPAHLWTQDISFLAIESRTGEVVFQILIGGTQGQNPQEGWHLPVLVRPEQVVPVTRALLDLFRVHGSREKRNRTRFRFLIERIGIGGVLEWLEQQLPFPLLPNPVEPVPAGSYDDLIGWFQQKDPDRWTMGLCVPLGRMTWRQLEGLAVLSKKWGAGQLRTTHEQGMAVIDIPTGFRDAAATDAAALGLSVHADPLDRNTMACTGSQFCNIAVTETKGHMFQLLEKLRRRRLSLHGIRIHMSGCPSSCAQHYTADIGLKGVRVRRLVGTREGFDVYLGGGLAGRVHLALPYRLGVDVEQLPNVIEEVVTEYYLRHKPGQTFSAYWREKLKAEQAAKVDDDDYKPPVWLCEKCDYRHVGEDPPVFCPSCAGLRRYFARLDDSHEQARPDQSAPSARREDGFHVVAADSSLEEGRALPVEVGGHDYALFRVNGRICAVDGVCPHEGAPLAEGTCADGIVTCPWHGWTFDVTTGRSLDPPGHDLACYDARIEDGSILIKTQRSADSEPDSPAEHPHGTRTRKPTRAVLTVLDVHEEAPDVRTFRLDNSAGKIALDYPGRFARICVSVNGRDIWRPFTISSSPTTPQHIDLTIKLNPHGEVTPFLFTNVRPGSDLLVEAPLGGFYYDPQKYPEPLVLISAGSGITPMMSIARYLAATEPNKSCVFLYGARRPADIIFHEECIKLARELPNFAYFVTLTQPDGHWKGPQGRLQIVHVHDAVSDMRGSRYFLCGPNDFMDTFRADLLEAGVPVERIHTEAFHAGKLITS